MRRGLRLTLAVSVSAGVLALGAGTAYAGNDPDGPSGDGDDGDHGSHATGCYKYDHDAKLQEEDFPSDHFHEAEANATKKDARDGHGKVYYTHNKICTAGHPWKGFDWHDDTFKTFKYAVKNGEPSYDKSKNNYYDHFNGYNDGYKYDKKKTEHKGPMLKSDPATNVQ